MIDMLRSLLFDPRPPRYIGRHRAPSGLPVITVTLRRRGDYYA